MKRNSCISCPDYLLSSLERIAVALSNQMSNEMTPFDNVGSSFKNDHFEVQAYSWGAPQSYNFKWKDIEISWYKHLGRMTTVNREVTEDEAIDLMFHCLKSLI